MADIIGSVVLMIISLTIIVYVLDFFFPGTSGISLVVHFCIGFWFGWNRQSNWDKLKYWIYYKCS